MKYCKRKSTCGGRGWKKIPFSKKKPRKLFFEHVIGKH